MRGIGTTVWVAAALVIALAACTKEEAPTPPPAKPAMEEQPMAPSGGMGAGEGMAPSGEAGSPEQMAPSGETAPSGEMTGGEPEG